MWHRCGIENQCGIDVESKINVASMWSRTMRRRCGRGIDVASSSEVASMWRCGIDDEKRGRQCKKADTQPRGIWLIEKILEAVQKTGRPENKRRQEKGDKRTGSSTGRDQSGTTQKAQYIRSKGHNAGTGEWIARNSKMEKTWIRWDSNSQKEI